MDIWTGKQMSKDSWIERYVDSQSVMCVRARVRVFVDKNVKHKPCTLSKIERL